MLPAPAAVFITVLRNEFRLRVYVPRRSSHGGVKMFEYEVATGVVGRATPAGEYRVVGKSRTPDWHAPRWASPDVADKILPYEDPQNPFEGGFIAIEDDDPDNDNSGVGLHGTKFPPRVGTRASHGCVRMNTPDFLAIYEKIPVGAVVCII